MIQVVSMRRPEQAAATASLAMDLAAGFLFRILLRADPTLQTDLQRWRSAVASLEDADPNACHAVRVRVWGYVRFGSEDRTNRVRTY